MTKYEIILKQLEDYFADLLIIQYRQAPKNRALIKMLVNLVFANNLLLQFRDLCLSVENSIGAQLDVVGKWVGIDRYYDGIDLWEQPYFALVSYDQMRSGIYEQYQGGFSNYENFDDNNGGFLTYENWIDTRTRINQMGDSFFRQLIKLKIIKNSIVFTNKNIDEAIYSWSNGEIYTTWQPNEVTYHYPQSWSNLMLLAIYKDVLLAPTGCSILTEVIS